jgi:hypothetical protein
MKEGTRGAKALVLSKHYLKIIIPAGLPRLARTPSKLQKIKI